MSKPKINLTGYKSLNFEVLYCIDDTHDEYVCKCVCGKRFTLKRRYVSERESCGCKKLKYGVRVEDIAEYKSWRKAKERCYYEKDARYKDYGARGIKMCDHWVNNFDNFIADMGKKPSAKHSLDRINNDKGYSPENCRWATLNEQARNKRHTVKIQTPDGEMSVHDASEKYGINVSTIKSRIHYGMSDLALISKKDLRYSRRNLKNA